MDLDGPALAPPEGVIPQLNNPPNQNGVAIGVLSACAVFATICFSLRGYARVVLLKKFQIEEVLVIIAYGCFWGATYCTLALIETPGYFVHTWNVRLRDVIPTQYVSFQSSMRRKKLTAPSMSSSLASATRLSFPP
ncbi:hypothetical protein BDW59DRAFT_4010 [Aspergillus cavernicola]|uniref:Integral membrane protein n=1 Tax=Aspergillus cavernicola TaxID=176166 RepID=A0ABR4J7N4_9EURO